MFFRPSKTTNDKISPIIQLDESFTRILPPHRNILGYRYASPDVELTPSEVPPLLTGLLSLPEHSGRGVALSYRALAPAGAGI